MVEVTVEYDYEALQDDELTLRVGDLIRNVRKLEEEGWCEGELNGKRGLFPDNFVKEVKKDTEAKEESPVIKREKSGNVANLVQRMSHFGFPIAGLPPQPKSLRRRRSKKRHCETLFDYIPQNEDELEIKTGDLIEIIEEVEEGWWRGILNEKIGLFPSNFVKELIDQTDDGDSSEISTEPDVPVKDLIGLGPTSPTSPTEFTGNESPGTGTTAQPKKIRGVGFGDIFKEGSVKLKSRLSNSDLEDKKSEKKPKKPLPSTKVQASKPEPPPAEKKLELKKVLPDKTDSISSRNEEKDDQKPTKPTAPMVPPKKPNLPLKGHPVRTSMPPRRPEKPSVPLPLPKINGEVPYNRPKSDVDSAVLRPKSEIQSSIIRPKSVELETDKAPEIDLMSFDSVELSGEKLSHPTASRPRMPGRRPPSVFVASHPGLGESHLDKMSKMIKEEEDEEIAKPKPSDVAKKPSLKQHTGVTNLTELKDITEMDNRNKTTVEDLKAQMADLMTFVERLRTQHRKELTELRNDFEEEKKQRIALQLEIDKLKKAVQST
ncbi:CD2-associated protein isoform X8 [Rhincodon typus]|uniref:CD2-associated protein isoform X8 n=1 Tax=Rhincodon typus TaxID=259920 RepID=UPI0020304304|nr:CD2-associated protein isoform X8 [Rhincodon typus]